MQDNITSRQLVEAALAFALSSLFQLLYAYWDPIASLFRWLVYDQRKGSLRPNSAQCSAVAFAVLGILFAGLFAAARDGRPGIPPHTAYPFFLAWKSVSLISLVAFEIIVVVIPLKPLLDWLFSSGWGIFVIVIGVLALLAHTAVGIWQLAMGGSEFVWAAPIYLHTVIGIALIAKLIALHLSGRLMLTRKRMWRFSCWTCIRLATYVLSIVSAAHGWELQHAIQCSVGVVVILEYAVWKELSPRPSPSGSGALAQHPTASSNALPLARGSAASTSSDYSPAI